LTGEDTRPGSCPFARRMLTLAYELSDQVEHALDVGLTTMVTAVTRSVRLLNNLAKLPRRSRQSNGVSEKERDRSGG